MADQRPYRVRGFSANRRLTQAKLLVLLALAAAFVAINWVTTQQAAKMLGHAPWLGPPLFHLSSIVIYAPWSWMVWWVRWYWAPQLAPLWQQCTHEALYPMATLTAIGCAAIAIVRQSWFADVSDLHGSARWGTIRDLKAARLLDRRRKLLRLVAVRLRLLRPLKRRAGIYLGLWQGWFRAFYLRDCSPSHVLVFAPTRSGKGAGVVVPTLLTWPHSVLVYDIKGENWGLTAGARKRAGQVCLKFAPTTDDSNNARFNPLAEIRLRTPNEDRDTRNLVEMIIDPHGQGLPDHWSREGSAFFSGIILHQLYSCTDKTLNGVEATLCDPEQPVDDTLQQIMRAVHDPSGAEGWIDSRGQPTRTHPLIARGMRNMLDKAPNERSGVISEVKGFLALYHDRVIRANTAVSDFSIIDLMNHQRPLSLYIVVPLADAVSARPLIRLLLSQIMHRLTERLEFRNGRAVSAFRRRLLLMIDEFPTLGRLDLFARSLSLVAGYGIRACLIAQDLIQIHAVYGHDEAITSNCHTRVAYAPNRIETAKILSEMVGQTTVRHAHRTTSNGGASVSEPEVARPLLTPDEASRLGAREELIFTNGQPVIRATKIRFYNDRFFKQLARPAPAKSDRIEHVEAVGHVAEITRDEAQPEPDLSEVVNGDEQRPSFLKSAEGKPNGSTDADQHDPKGRLL